MPDGAPQSLRTAHGDLPLPVFLPDATRAGVRAVDSHDLREVGIEGVVVNSFHLLRSPGARLIKQAGGIHQFMDWDRPVISDSGGFQVYSLIRQNPAAGVIRPNEVIFREPATHERISLTPERCVQIQFQLGTDVMMCLDDCTNAEDDLAVQEASVERTIRWARRCKAEFLKLLGAHSPSGRRARQTAAGSAPAATSHRQPLIFAVVQGGASFELRRRCAAELAAIGFDGFGFGGWPIDASGGLLGDLLAVVAESLPAGVPLHALGVGRPDHVVSAARLGYTIFDCSLPTRDARHHRLYTFSTRPPDEYLATDRSFFDSLHILDQRYANDFGPIDPTCDAACCLRYSRAYLRHLFKVQDISAERLATVHNLRFYTRLIDRLRLAG